MRLAASNVNSRPVGLITVSAGGAPRRVSYTYPTPRRVLRHVCHRLLRTTFEYFKQQDLISDLQKHLEQRAAKAAGDAIYCLLAVAYTQVWNEDQEHARHAGRRDAARAQ